jgi:hypothetical protein
MTGETRLDRECKRTCSTFHLAVGAFRELVSFLSESIPALEKAQTDRFNAALTTRFKEIPAAQRPVVAEFLTSFIERIGKDAKAKAEGTQSDAPKPPLEAAPLKSLNVDGADAITFFLKTTDRLLRLRQADRLYSAIVTGVVAQFEVLVGDLAREFYRSAPNAVDSKAKSLSLADLEQLGSVEAAIEYLIDNKVDGLLAESLEDWAAFFESHLKVDLRALTDDWGV